MKKIILLFSNIALLTSLSGFLMAGRFGESFGGSLAGSFLGTTVSNVATRPRTDGRAVRASDTAIDIAQNANNIAMQAGEKATFVEGELNRLRAEFANVNSKLNMLEEDNKRLKGELDSLHEKFRGLERARVAVTREERQKRWWWPF